MNLFTKNILFAYVFTCFILTHPMDIIAADFAETTVASVSSTTVIEHVQKAKAALCYYLPTAQVEFTTALDLVKRAIAGDTRIDVSGSVGKGIFKEQVTYLVDGSFKRIPGSTKEEMYYDESWSLTKRASQLAYYAGNCAERQKNHLAAAQLYAEAGDLSFGTSPNFHKFLAMQYAILEDCENIRVQIEKTTSLADHKYDESYDFVLSQLANICRTQADKLSDTDPEMADQFMEKAAFFFIIYR